MIWLHDNEPASTADPPENKKLIVAMKWKVERAVLPSVLAESVNRGDIMLGKSLPIFLRMRRRSNKLQRSSYLLLPTSHLIPIVLSERRKSCGWEQTRSQLAGLYLVSTWHNLCFLSEEIDQTEMILGSRRHLRAQWFMNSFTCMEENGACELLG